MSSRPKLKPSKRVSTEPLIPSAMLHDAQLAAFVLGRYSRKLPASDDEAQEFAGGLAVWEQLGDKLPKQLWPVRDRLIELVRLQRERAAAPPPSGLLGQDGLPIEAKRTLLV